MVNPYEVSHSTTLRDTGSAMDAQSHQVMRLPGMALAIQGWTLTILYSVGLLISGLALFLDGQSGRQIFFEAGIPMAFALAMAIQLVRCGISTMRCESRSKAYGGAVLSALLFLPLGIFICIWVVRSLNRKEVVFASDAR